MEITKSFILEIFKENNLSEKYKDALTSPSALDLYQTAFTSAGYDPNQNYELFEFVGDSILGESLVWYFYTIFPQLRCTAGIKTLNRLKIKYAASKTFSKIALDLKFLPYIRALPEELASDEKKQSLLEDVFEAFAGVTKIILTERFNFACVGNQVITDLVTVIFNKKNISLEPEKLYDPKTRLKELFDIKTSMNNIFMDFGAPVYESYHDEESTKTRLYFKKRPDISFLGAGHTLAEREKKTAKQALHWLQTKGYKVEKQFAPFCPTQL